VAELRRADNQWRRTDEADRTPASSRALRDTGTALLNPPPQRNSAAPDASPWRGWMQSNQASGAAPVCLLPFVPARAPRRQFVF
jgi:hypothetical protein